MIKYLTKRHNLSIFFTSCLLCFSTMTEATTEQSGMTATVTEIVSLGNAAVNHYNLVNGDGVAAEFSSIYFNVFEAKGLELTLGARDKEAMQRVESGFSRVIQTAIKHKPKADLMFEWAALRDNLQLSAAQYGHAESTMGEAFTQSFLILLREGAEAILVVAALAALMRRTGKTAGITFLWVGVVAAILASLLLAWGLNALLANAGTWRGLFEGVIVLIAALLMAYVSAWLYARREAARWNDYLKAQLQSNAHDYTPWTAAIVAFLAIFREGAETTLFYQALVQSTPNQNIAILSGAGVAFLALLVLFTIVLLMGRKLPFKPFFTTTALLLFFLAVTFVGKGVMELQLAGAISNTGLDLIPSISWLGLYPTFESVAMQLFLIAGFIFLAWRSSQALSLEAKDIRPV